MFEYEDFDEDFEGNLLERISMWFGGVFLTAALLFTIFILPPAGQSIDSKKLNNIIDGTKAVIAVSYFAANPMAATSAGIVYMVASVCFE